MKSTKKKKQFTKISDIYTLSAYGNGMHETSKSVIGDHYTPSLKESLAPIGFMLEELMGENWDNIGKKVRVTVELLGEKK